jgi:hypothetical protein
VEGKQRVAELTEELAESERTRGELAHTVSVVRLSSPLKRP